MENKKQKISKKVKLGKNAMNKLDKYKQIGELSNWFKEPFLNLMPNKMLQCVVCLIDNNFLKTESENKEISGSYKELLRLFKQIGISIEDKKRVSECLSKFTKLSIEERKGFDNNPKNKIKYKGFMLFQKWEFDEEKDYFSLVPSYEFYKRLIANNYFAVRDIKMLKNINTNAVFILTDIILKNYAIKTRKSYFKIENINDFQARFNDKKRWVDFRRYILEPSLQKANTLLYEKLRRPFWYKTYKTGKVITAIEIVPWDDTPYLEGWGIIGKNGEPTGTPLYYNYENAPYQNDS